MPNHVTTRLYVAGPTADVDEFIAKTMTRDPDLSGELKMDFRTVLPEPPEVVKSIEDNPPNVIPLWRTWHIENWGTKWNNYGPEFDPSSVNRLPDGDSEFETTLTTAWSFPMPVVIECARKFRRLKFHAEYADEDLGNNCGEFTVHWGELGDLVARHEEKDGDVRFACEVKGFDYDELMKERNERCTYSSQR